MRTGQFPPGQLSPRTFATYDNCPQDNYPQTIAPPPNNSHFGKLLPDNCTRTISSYDNWPPGQMTPGHLQLRAIPIRVIASKRLYWIKVFAVFHFAVLTIKYFININMHFFKTNGRFPYRLISQIFDLLSKVWKVFIASLILAY